MATGYITLALPQEKKHHKSYPKAFTVNTTHNNTADQYTKNEGYHSPIKRRLFHEGIFNGGLKYRQISPSPKICIDHSRYAPGGWPILLTSHWRHRAARGQQTPHGGNARRRPLLTEYWRSGRLRWVYTFFLGGGEGGHCLPTLSCDFIMLSFLPLFMNVPGVDTIC